MAAKILWIGLGMKLGRGRASLKGSYITSILLVGVETSLKLRWTYYSFQDTNETN